MEIYQSSKSNISEHIKHIFEDKELDKTVVVRKFRTTTQHGALEGKTQSHDVAHYNLDVIIALDDQILRLRKNILEGTGTVSHQEAIEKAEREFEIYREREMRLLESDFDKAVKRLKNLNDESNEEEN